MQKSSIPITNISGDLTDEHRSKNVFNISVGTAALLGLLLLITIVLNRSFTKDLVAVVTLAVGMIVFGISAWLSRQNGSILGAVLNIAVLSSIVVSRVFIQRGLAIQTGVVYIVLISAIAVYTLPRKWAGRAVVFAFVTALSTIIVDQYTTGLPQSSSAQYVTWISIIVGIIYMFVIGLQFPNFPLRAKLLTSFLFLTILPLIILGWLAYLTTNNIVETQIKADILRTASSTAAEFQDFLDSQFSLIRSQARTTEIVEYMSLPESRRKGTSKETLVYDELKTISKTKPSYINSYALLDINGIDILDTERSRIGTSFAEQEFFTTVITSKNHYVSDLTILPDGSHLVYFATPITSKSGELTGVYVVTYNANIIQSTIERMIRTNQLTVSTTEYTYIIDGVNYFVLAHTTRVDLLYKTYLGTDDARLVKLQELGVISRDKLNTLVIPQPEVVIEIDKMENTINFRAPSYNGELTESAAVRLPNSNWVVVTSQPSSTISNIIQAQTRANVIVSIIITVFASLVALVVSNILTTPILQLTRAAEKIAAGDFSQRPEIRVKDEIGVLARTLNTMIDQVQELIGNLEIRVEQRTADLAQRSSDLEKATAESDKRAGQLETIAEISRYISTEKDQEKLFPLITQIVSERFGFYHVGIFLLDETGNFAVLRAANSPGGQTMLRRQHKLEVGQTGIVGNVTFTGKPRIALETGADATYFNNPDLPETRSEMALPLIARATIIGALDVQSTTSNAFSDEDISIISLLADQVAIAIDNVRLLAEAQAALAESQAVFSEYLAEAWQRKSDSAVIGYYQTLSGGKLITAQNQTGEINTSLEHENGRLAVPIHVRDQIIGTLNIMPNSDGKTWSEDEVNIVQAVTERLGLALDNARLFEETSTRASRERLVSDITTRIRGTNDPQEMIKTAVEELQRALGASRIEIVPRKISHPTDK